MVGARDKVGAL